MSTLSLFVCAVLAIVIDTVWVALFRAQPVGKFKVLRDGDAVFQFQTDLGWFTILPKEGKLNFKGSNGNGSVVRADLKGLEFRVNESIAVMQELFFGLNGTDLLARYMDTVDWFSLTAVTVDGRRIPLYLSGQYTPREFLLSWYIELQATVLRRLGLLVDVEEQSRQVMETVCDKLGRPRLL